MSDTAVASYCPNCDAEISSSQSSCPHCGKSLPEEVRKKQDAEYLAKDSWSFSKEAPTAPEPKDFRGPPHPRGDTPSGAGFQGYRRSNHPFNRTLGMSFKPDEVDEAAAPATDSPQSDFQKIDSVSSKHTSTNTIDTHVPSPDAPKHRPSKLAHLFTFQPRTFDDGQIFTAGIGIAAAVLIALWWIPDAIGTATLWPFEQVRSTHGADLVGLLIAPMAGAALIVILLLPTRPRIRASAALPISVAALSLPLYLNTQALLLDGPIALITAYLAVGSATVAFILLRSWITGHVVLLLFPAALLGAVFWDVATGQYPLGHVAAFKDPLELYATTLAASLSAVQLLKTNA